ncbi:hypothetical protein F5141DRAFT_1000438, partial [Pisolithus sp. B1]
IDKVLKDRCMLSQCYGQSRKGRRANKKQIFIHGCHTSTAALLTLNGIATGTVVEGSMTHSRFMEWLEHNIISFLLHTPLKIMADCHCVATEM